MADERDRWLDRAAADKLLRGEPVEPVGPAADPRARREAARLRAALDSLAQTAPAASAAGELPGEAAAVAAFRAAHGTTAASASSAPSAVRTGTARSREPLVDLGRAAGLRVPAPRRARAVRFGLAAALASVAVGGLAAAAGAGLLDPSGRDTAGPGPAMSVSADGDPTAGDDSGASTLSPQLRPTPLRDGTDPAASAGTSQPPGTDGYTAPGGDTFGGTSPGTSTTGGTGSTQGGKDHKDGQDGTFRTDGTPDGSGDGSTSRDRDQDRENQRRAVDLCNDYRAGHLNDDRRERLSRLAKGLARIPYYCEALLDGVVNDGGGRMSSPGTPAGGGTYDGIFRSPTSSPAPVPSRL
ncbi:hypothetical protein OG765_14315 [Streptomyces sp. NBC_00555]|uniref:hypothetical protein n=1 Tax=Streptomyces sp. NBC_00555 TaxID=2903662 RepID=UPI0022573C31|nr:hypothetical protein [Streptomyces sp. NBC_00555]MCX5012160.1 hypothetical protein [Streptomyces sp. NBC_00555]